MTQSDGWWSIDRRHDRDHASDGYSRYGAYLAHRIDQAIADDDLDDPVRWTAWCWSVATPPVMAPALVQTRDPVLGSVLWRDPDTGCLAATVRVAAPLPAGLTPGLA
jgi:hypothetical protein